MFMRFIPLLRPTHRSYINKSYAFTEWNKIRFRKKIRNNYIHRFSIFHYKRTPFSFGSFLSTFVVFSSQVFIWNFKAVFFRRVQFSLRLFIGAGTVPITTKPINTLEMCQFNTISISSARIILLSPLSSTRSYKRFINYAHIRRKLQIIDYVDFSALQRFLCPSSVQQNDFRELSTSIGGCFAMQSKCCFCNDKVIFSLTVEPTSVLMVVKTESVKMHE